MPAAIVLWVPREQTPYQETVDSYQLTLIRSALEVAHWSARVLRYQPDTLERSLGAAPGEVIFNLAYGYRNDAVFHSQPDIAKRLEQLGCACVGTRATAQELVQDKRETARVLARCGIPSPAVLNPDDWPAHVAHAVLKPRRGAKHRGIRLVTRDQRDCLPPRLEEDWLLQEFVDGPEYTVGVLEDPAAGTLTVLPPLRIRFDSPSQTAMMCDDGPDWTAVAEPAVADVLAPVAAAAFRTLGIRDYARFDLRIGPDGPVMLEANALPGMHPVNGLFPMAAAAAGLDYHVLVQRLVANAWHRRGDPAERKLPC